MVLKSVTKNPVVGAVVAALLIAFAAFNLVRALAPSQESSVAGDIWYYDLNEQKLFAAQRQMPPIPAPSGALPDGTPAGVLAHVFSCGECVPGQQFIGYLEKQSDQSRAMAESNTGPSTGPDARDALYAGQYVRLPDGRQWVPIGSEAGRTIISTVRGQCPPGKRRVCVPSK